MDLPALERCVGNVGTFLHDYWGRAPLFRRRPGSDRGFDDLASLDDLDAIVASFGLPASSLRMVQNGRQLSPSSYAKRSSTAGGVPAIDAALVYERFYEGATIVMEALHRHWAPLSYFCRDLELALGHRVQVNAYITPPSSQGFAVHRDDHDVFILQVWGDKRWQVFDRDEESLLIDRELEEGASLYIPKGFPHAATTQVTASAHLTVGVLTHNSLDILSAVTRLAEEEPSFHTSFPPGTATDRAGLRSVVEGRIEELRAWMDAIDMEALTERVARRVMSSSQPLIGGQLRQLQQLDTIDGSTKIARRRGATCILFPKDTVLKVLLMDRELQMPLAAEAAMEEIARRDSLRVHDLHAFLDTASAVVLVRRLVREGLLEVAIGE